MAHSCRNSFCFCIGYPGTYFSVFYGAAVDPIYTKKFRQNDWLFVATPGSNNKESRFDQGHSPGRFIWSGRHAKKFHLHTHRSFAPGLSRGSNDQHVKRGHRYSR